MSEMETERCPSPQALADFARGLLAGEELSWVGTHIDRCAACEATLRELERQPDAFLAALGRVSASEPAGIPRGDLGDLSGLIAVLGRATGSLGQTQEATPHPSASTVGAGGPSAHPLTEKATDPSAETLPWDSTDDPSREPDSAAIRAIGRYQIKARLGRGAFGSVFLAWDPGLERDVAIKVAHPHRVRSKRDVERYLNEARTLAALDHPNVLPVFDAGRTAGGLCYVVAKYVEGTDLSTLLRRGKPPAAEAAYLIERLCAGLEHAHQQKLIHRDIKPANILIASDGQPYLADFGLALREEDFDRGPAFAGTPDYMSPEQARGESHRVDGRSDIYSLGVVFYQLLTGTRPYKAENIDGMLRTIVSTDIPPPRRDHPDVPPELERICLKMLAKRSADRYQTAAEVAEDLRAWELDPSPAGSPPHAPPVPKGLRGFDAHDAGFYLDLLPGPRDRDGLPESVAFWKRRIEAAGAAGGGVGESFTVGLMLGSSGSGKSSLIRAGLLPRLGRQIIPVYVEAAPGQTVARLLAAVRTACPRVAQNVSLRETLAAIRRGADLHVARKVLIVLDQFEQHLADDSGEPDPEDSLAAALRQCDGTRLQALLVARDDFALAATQFLDRLEVPLAQGENFATLDRFEPDHARAVLTAFGQSLGRLPMALSKPQRDFLDRAVRVLAEEGRISPVRLALFVAMLGGRDWTPAALRQIGGAEGLGVAFLDDSITAGTAHPKLRQHAAAVRSILAALLPPPGIGLKGAMRPRSALVAVALDGNPGDCDELLHLLDADLRLITPTTPPGEGSDETHYQLTHDYLVGSLRVWLSKAQRATFRGRMALRLSERAAEWNAQPLPRNLPAWWDLPLYALAAGRRSRSEPERRMLRAASRYHGIRAGIGLALAGSLLAAALVQRSRFDERRGIERAEDGIQQLLTADAASLPASVEELRPLRRWAAPELAAIVRDPARPHYDRQRARYALLDSDATLAAGLADDMMSFPRELAEALVFRDALIRAPGNAASRFWTVLHDLRQRDQSRFRAALALAGLDPEGKVGGARGWEEAAGFVAGRILKEIEESPVDYRPLREAFRPVRSALAGPLLEVACRTEGNARARAVAAKFLVDLDPDNPHVLVPLALGGDSAQLVPLLELLERHREQAIPLLTAELDRPAPPQAWSDPPIPADWKRPAAETVKSIEAARGMITDRFAFCQTLPLPEVRALADALRPAGYRPVRVRPYLDGDHVSAAVTWTRDGKAWRLETDIEPGAVVAASQKVEADGFDPVDIAGYLPTRGASAERYACLWAVPDAEGPRTEFKILRSDDVFRRFQDQLASQSGGVYARQQLTHRVVDLADGSRSHAVVVARTPWGLRNLETSRFEGITTDYHGDRFPGRVLTDVDIGLGSRRMSRDEYWSAGLAEFERQLAVTPDDPGLFYNRANKLFELGRLEESKRVLDGLVAKYPPYAWQFQVLRSMANARLGRDEASRKDYEACRELAAKNDPNLLFSLNVYLAAYSGRFEEGRRLVETRAAAHPKDAVTLIYASLCAAALAEQAIDTKHADAPKLTEYSIDLLRRALDAGHKLTEPELFDYDAFRDHPKLVAVVGKSRLADRYTVLWQAVQGLESTEVHGLNADEHLARCRELAAQGYRPTVATAFRALENAPAVAASAWQRPLKPAAVQQREADRVATAALALLRLGKPEAAWSRLAAQPDPRVATEIIHRAAASGVAPELLVQKLADEPRADIRRALLLALGEYTLSSSLADSVRKRALDLFQSDPDPGVHSAAAWLLSRKGYGADLKKAAAALVGSSRSPRRNWFVNGQGQTFSIVRGPVTFLMGAPANEGDLLSPEEGNQRWRKIDRSFALAVHEVTNAEFQRFLDENPDVDHSFERFYSNDPEGPVCNVTWFNAARYCRWLTAKEGLGEDTQCYAAPELKPRERDDKPKAVAIDLKVGYLTRAGYRLPTDAEWECAARAGTRTPRSFGWSDERLGAYEWSKSQKSFALERPHPVGQLRPNPLGLFDLLGNVAEWTTTREDITLRPAADGSANDPEQPGRITGEIRLIFRGAAANDPPTVFRSSSHSPRGVT